SPANRSESRHVRPDIATRARTPQSSLSTPLLMARKDSRSSSSARRLLVRVKRQPTQKRPQLIATTGAQRLPRLQHRAVVRICDETSSSFPAWASTSIGENERAHYASRVASCQLM